MLLLSLLACNAVRPTDDDNDGWFSNVDCNDDNPFINPGADEIPGDGTDNDCNLQTRDDDYDQDGVVGMDDCNEGDPTVPGPEVPYDGVDNDCNAQTPDDDLDGDGFGIDEDCDDDEPLVYPGASEIPGDGVDNDCDPLSSDVDADGDGFGPSHDCDDTNPDVQGPAAWFADCDSDDFATLDAEMVFACTPPAPPTDCPLNGTWTTIEPTGTPLSPDNDRIDCADEDPLAFPGQTAWFDQPVFGGLGSWDYDCDGEEAFEFEHYDCERLASTSACNVTPGFVNTIPSCGEPGLWSGACVLHVDVCVSAFASQETQRCH